MSWPKFWFENTWQSKLLIPLSLLVCKVAAKRLKKFEKYPPQPIANVVVIVIGNITVGGSGKTPFIQWLASQLEEAGLSYGVISRGYGGKSKTWPLMVTANSSPQQVGDEPVLLAKSLNCPLVVSPKRAEAVEFLLKHQIVDVIISDDGLQHFALSRDIEIVIMDSQRNLGNGLCLPSGPLREAPSRLNKVDYIVYNGGKSSKQINMQLKSVCFRQVSNPKNHRELDYFANQEVIAIAGIGNPQRFFKQLASLNIQAKEIAFSDHHAYHPKDFAGLDTEKPLLMTQKDAVKCTEFAKENWWYLEILPTCPASFSKQLIAEINSKIKKQ